MAQQFSNEKIERHYADSDTLDFFERLTENTEVHVVVDEQWDRDQAEMLAEMAMNYCVVKPQLYCIQLGSNMVYTTGLTPQAAALKIEKALGI